MSSRVVYTSVFGNYDDIVEQKLPENWDWKCFSENNSLPMYTDNNRNAKKFKVLPHRYLSEYEYSIFIDCVHTYQHLKSDVDNSLNTFDKPILMFDDYGLFPDLKRLIDEYIDMGKFKVLKKIGQHNGKIYPKTQNKVLLDREGIICQAV